MSQLALKRLSASDLTFFKSRFLSLNIGKQKAINLNADVFVADLFPALRNNAPEQLPVALYLYGPGLKSELALQRKIVKGASYKNWRLNGEFVDDPLDDPNRFEVLRESDIAVLEFNDGAVPTLCRCVLLAADGPDDSALHRELLPLVLTKSMVSLDARDLQVHVAASLVSAEHPIHALGLDTELEDAVQGGIEGMRQLAARRAQRRILRGDLLSAKRRADENGQRGEVLVNVYLQDQRDSERIADFVWESADNAVAPYDFLIIHDGAEHEYVDVKSTSGEFERPLHISLAELHEMAQRDRYSLFRVFELSDDGGQVRVATDLQSFARRILEVTETLPRGVAADSVSVRPEALPFGEPIQLYSGD